MNYEDIKTYSQRHADLRTTLTFIDFIAAVDLWKAEVSELRAYIESVVRVRQTPEGVFWEQN